MIRNVEREGRLMGRTVLTAGCITMLTACASANPQPVATADPVTSPSSVQPARSEGKTATTEQAKPTIRVEMENGVPTTVVVEAPNEQRMTWFFLARGITRAGGRIEDGPVKSLRLVPESLRPLFLPGEKTAPEVAVTVAYEGVGKLEFRTDSLRPLYEFWFAEAEEAAIPGREIASGQCTEKRSQALNEAVAKMKVDLDAGGWKSVRLIETRNIVASGPGQLVELPAGKGKGDVHICALGFDQPKVVVERLKPAVFLAPGVEYTGAHDESEKVNPSSGCDRLLQLATNSTKTASHQTHASNDEKLKVRVTGNGCVAIVALRNK